ncbi:peptidoglycan DD-metalloendopeptidase family protein [Shimazuella sp. AN120528]|uniref:M23 family metallopeptidase n=1 Tax=Shimazuella soli TaxID=1892854 RepID=UPI001F0E7896|nr:M23 family metallopeptidase [Shimazuella soli]MCH5585310.1 peptidoglycan DD-metalloendopeptidase family protein [Shimazuella soli]
MQRTKRILTATIAVLVCASIIVGSSTEVDAKTTREELMQIRKDKLKVMDSIASGNKTLEKYNAQMAASQKAIDDVQVQVDKVDVLKKQAEQKEEVYQKKFNERLRQLYERGETGYMSQLLQSNNFSEFLVRFEMVRLLAQQDYALLEDKKKATEQVQVQIDKLNQLIAKQQKEVDKSKDAFNKMMAEINKSKGKLKELQGMEDANESELIDINKALISSGKLKFPYTGPLQRPMDYPITSGFKFRWGRMHEGVDFGTQGKIGIPYRAAADGVVVESRVSSGYGWLITIYHGEYNGQPFYTRYAHSYPYEVKVKVGQEVTKGEIISAVGNNGHSTGPHLHFEVRIGYGAKPPAKDPMKYFGS